NNAGIAEVSRLADQSFETWRRVLDVNLDAVYSIAQEAARRLARAQKPGVIINIASVLGFATAKGLSAYAVAKAGVVQLTRALALELAPAGIRANAIAPGWIVTEINRDFLASPRGAAMVRSIPLKRFGQTGDLDGVLLLLASDAGRYITGATYVVDGGQLIALSS
ncbi:MAG: SDR family oxidoreductase, partial [Methylobacteriaceae bacterium]|nr:SDR family oxidoreductase [Methylobacteriaceae bacterium]